MADDEVVFDAQSGISVEEQREILSQINGIAEKNKKLLSESAVSLHKGVKKGKINLKAGKKDALFPLAVNIAAAAVLVIGAFFLVSFNGNKDTQARTGGAVYNVTERAILNEIRKSTAEQIAAKETEIANIASRLSAVDDELLQLYSSNETLTVEQLAAQQRLLAMQNVFREELSTLQEERSNILEESRSREARLRAQLEERTKEFAAAQQKVSGELNTAVSELERLAGEQQKIAAADAQLSGGFAAISGYVKESRYEQAEQAVNALRQFINSSSLASSRSFQLRRDFYTQSLNFMETMIEDARRNSGTSSGAEQFDLLARNLQLEENIAEMQKTLDAINSGSSGQLRRIGELEERIASLEQASAEKDKNVSSLETENAALSASLTQLQNTNAAQEQEINNLRNQITIIRQALQEN